MVHKFAAFTREFVKRTLKPLPTSSCVRAVVCAPNPKEPAQWSCTWQYRNCLRYALMHRVSVQGQYLTNSTNRRCAGNRPPSTIKLHATAI
jgi:hypothetical protein